MVKVTESIDRKTLKHGFYPFLIRHAEKHNLFPKAHYDSWGEIYPWLEDENGDVIATIDWRYFWKNPFCTDGEIITLHLKNNERLDDILAACKEWEFAGGREIEVVLDK